MLLGQNNSEAVVRLLRIVVEPDRFPKLLYGFVRLATGIEGDAQVAMRVRIIAFETNRLPTLFYRIVELLLFDIDFAQK